MLDKWPLARDTEGHHCPQGWQDRGALTAQSAKCPETAAALLYPLRRQRSGWIYEFSLGLWQGCAHSSQASQQTSAYPVEAGALWRAACSQGMRPGLTVPFSSLPTSWLNVSRPAGKHTAPFSAQTPPKEQSSINKVYGKREAPGDIPTGPRQGEWECPVGSAAHLGELPRWSLLRAAWSLWRQTAYLKNSIRGLSHTAMTALGRAQVQNCTPGPQRTEFCSSLAVLILSPLLYQHPQVCPSCPAPVSQEQGIGALPKSKGNCTVLLPSDRHRNSHVPSCSQP